MFFPLYRRIIIAAGITLASIAIIVPVSRLLGADSPSVAYLKGKPLSPWSIMALSAAGESPSLDSLKTVSAEKAIDLEAPILALTAAGKDPRSFGSVDLIAKLKGFYDGAQLGDAAILNDDIFGLLALIASGEKQDSAEVAGIKSFIISKQSGDGGFSFAVVGTSDTNTTAAAVMALRAAGVSSSDSILTKAVGYLQSAQNSDGGFPYDPKGSWGTASDASSDAWVIMAKRALGEDAFLWQKDGKTPAMHLETLKQEGGFYLYQNGGAEDSFTPVATSYALLALSGKTLPVKVIAPETPAGVAFSIQVEGKVALLCDADGTGVTVIDALKVAASACGLQYHLQSSSLGDYVDEIAGEKASGSSGWLYAVNRVLPSVGAGAYKMKERDAVRWYFGNFDGTAASDSVRTEISLSAIIPEPQAGNNGSGWNNGGGNAQNNENTISMTVEIGKSEGGSGAALGFGAAARGAVVAKTIALKNGGGVAVTLSTSVSGDAVFRRYLRLSDKSWREYRATLAPQAATTTTLSLAIPSDYEGSGVKNGALIFWATPAAR